MKRQLILQLAAADDTTETLAAQWVVREPGRPVSSVYHGELRDVLSHAGGARVVVLAPATDVLMTHVQLPAMNRQRLAKAVPFALEDQLTQDVDDLHFAVGSRSEDGEVPCAIVAREQIDVWQALIHTAGLQADVYASELSAVPYESGAWTLLIGPERVLIRTAPQRGVALDTANLLPLLKSLLLQEGAVLPLRLIIYRCEDAEFPIADVHALAAERAITVDLIDCDEPLLVVLARSYDDGDAINLLQGDYSRREQLEKLLRPWRPVLILFAALMVLQLIVTVIDYRSLAQANSRLQQQVSALYQEAFPGARSIPPSLIRKETESKLAALRGGAQTGGAEFLPLLSQVGGILKETPGLTIRSLRFQPGQLDLDVEIGDLQALDNLKNRLSQVAGLQAELVSASQRDRKVEGRLQLRGAAS